MKKNTVNLLFFFEIVSAHYVVIFAVVQTSDINAMKCELCYDVLYLLYSIRSRPQIDFRGFFLI